MRSRTGVVFVSNVMASLRTGQRIKALREKREHSYSSERTSHIASISRITRLSVSDTT